MMLLNNGTAGSSVDILLWKPSELPTLGDAIFIIDEDTKSIKWRLPFWKIQRKLMSTL